MYCSKCGKEIENGEKYCSTCGAKVVETGEPTVPDSGFSKDLRQIIERITSAGENKVTMILACILPIASIALLGQTMFGISYEVFGYTDTFYYSMFENADFLKAMFYIGYIIALGILVFPAFTDGKWSKKNFIPGMILPVAAGIAFAIAIFGAKNEIASEQYAFITKAINLNVRISGSGWLFLTSSLVSLLATLDAYLGAVLKRVRNVHGIKVTEDKGVNSDI